MAALIVLVLTTGLALAWVRQARELPAWAPDSLRLRDSAGALTVLLGGAAVGSVLWRAGCGYAALCRRGAAVLARQQQPRQDPGRTS